MRLQSIKQMNITVLFPVPLNHALISIQELIKDLKKDNQEQDKTTVVDAPGLKALTYPNRAKDIVYEQNRLLINDRESLDPDKSSIFDYLDKGFKQTIQDRKSIAAYGFNFDVIAMNTKKGDFLNQHTLQVIRKIGEIQEQGSKVIFARNGKRFDLQLTPTGSKGELLVHLNVHYSKSELPEIKILKKEVESDFGEFKKLIDRL